VETPISTRLNWSEPVAEMAEHHAPQRPRDEAHRIGAEGGDDPVQLIAGLREEQLAEDERGGGAVEEEFVPLDHRPRHRRADDLAEIGEIGGGLVLHAVGLLSGEGCLFSRGLAS
jgi:hypothetical protein